MTNADETPEDRSGDAKAGTEPPNEGVQGAAAGARHRSQARIILIEFLENVFQSYDSLRSFCSKYFPEVESELKDTDRRSNSIGFLTGFCETSGRTRELWDFGAILNKEKHEEFFPRWMAVQQMLRDEREAKHAEYMGSTRSRPVESDPSSLGHPLSSGKPEQVSDWFFNELGPGDRGTVLATALFQGMRRSHLAKVGQDFAKLFGGAPDRSADELPVMNDPKDEVIEILASLLRKQGESVQASPQPLRGDYRAFARTGISIIEVSRNTEIGITPIQSLGFATEAARETALGLLGLPALYAHLPQMYEYLRQQGYEKASELRYFSAVAVSVLTRVLPFVELKDNVVLPWAKSGNVGCMDSAAIALAETLAAGRYEAEILALVRHWAKTGQPSLAQVALATFTSPFTPARSNAALAVIEAIMATAVWWPLFHEIRRLFRQIVERDSQLAIAALHRWLAPARVDSLRLLSALLAIEFLQLEDAIEGEDAGALAAELIGTLWDDANLPRHPEIQEVTTEMIKDWACRTLALADENRPEEFARYRQWFQMLHKRYANQRSDRLRTQLKHWDYWRERSLQRMSSGRGATKAAAIPGRPYTDLLGSE